MRTILMVAVLAFIPSTAGAQEDLARWLPWIGCWQSPAERLAGDGGRICIAPADGGGVQMLTVVGDQISRDQTVVADGLIRAIVEPPCTGTRRGDWSRNAHLLFTRAELVCEGGQRQKISGLHLFTSGPTWVDIQIVEASGRENVRARRYERLSVPPSVADLLPPQLVAQATDAAERLAREPLTVDEIIEASGKMAATGIEAALFETKPRFALSSRSLIALQDGGVEEPVIDLMLAISYPHRFAVNRWAASVHPVDLFPEDAIWGDWAFSRPYWGYGRLSFNPYYGTTWYDSGWDLRYFRRGDSSLPADSFGVTAPPSASGGGSVVNGQGYTRGRPPVSTSNESSNGPSTGTSSSSGIETSSSSSSSGSDRGGSSGSSNASPGGYSSGSSGSSGSSDGGGGGRTAVDRD